MRHSMPDFTRAPGQIHFKISKELKDFSQFQKVKLSEKYAFLKAR